MILKGHSGWYNSLPKICYPVFESAFIPLNIWKSSKLFVPILVDKFSFSLTPPPEIYSRIDSRITHVCVQCIGVLQNTYAIIYLCWNYRYTVVSIYILWKCIPNLTYRSVIAYAVKYARKKGTNRNRKIVFFFGRNCCGYKNIGYIGYKSLQKYA